ncbi:MAG: hypothetical protein AAF768_00470 [Pseudomonadota bacterium]
MQFNTNGQQAEIIYKPWFNWIMMGAISLVCLGGALFFFIMAMSKSGQHAEMLNTVALGTVGIGLICGLAIFTSPTKTVVFDRGRRQFTFRNDYIFGQTGKPRSFSEIGGLDVKQVRGNGPEAYWVKLKLKKGKKLKFAPHAFTPQDARTIKTIIQESLRGGGASASPSRLAQSAATPRRGFGRAIPQ